MPSRPLKICSHPSCSELVKSGKCEQHSKQEQQRYDRQRGTAHDRGYNYRWSKYSQWFLRQPENVFCKLQLPGCTNLSKCVDHIDPPDGPNDPRFWDPKNHQGGCIHCNSKKGHTMMIGEGEPFSSYGRGV